MQVFGENETQGRVEFGYGCQFTVDLYPDVHRVVLFKTYRKPTIILLMVPLIFIGVVFGLAVTGKMLDFFAILGYWVDRYEYQECYCAGRPDRY